MARDIDFAALAAPFPATDIEWRMGSCGKSGDKFWGKVLAYITNRAIMERLDDVCGPENWRNEYAPAPGGTSGILCGLSIRIDGAWLTKWDGAEETDIESVKGGLSNSMKRAGVQWGIGRYLYQLEEGWATIADDNDRTALRAQTKDKQFFRWHPPKLAAWALPGGSGKPGVVSLTQHTRAETAKAVLRDAEQKAGVRAATVEKVEKVDAARTDPGDVQLPGTKAHFAGHGGKRLADLSSPALETAMQDLKTVDAVKYAPVIEAIGEVLAERAGAAEAVA